ncbi:MAG: hypothetical protein ACI9WU_000355, partial [Myxococcota bacterium]
AGVGRASAHVVVAGTAGRPGGTAFAPDSSDIWVLRIGTITTFRRLSPPQVYIQSPIGRWSGSLAAALTDQGRRGRERGTVTLYFLYTFYCVSFGISLPAETLSADHGARDSVDFCRAGTSANACTWPSGQVTVT